MALILLVDDDPQVLRTSARLLSVHNHQVLSAASGLAALRIVMDEPIELVVSDLNMRPLDGLDLLRRLRMTHPDLPFILMSGDVEVDQVAEAMQFGLSNLLLKPTEPARFEEAVQGALAQASNRRLAQGFKATTDRVGLLPKHTLELDASYARAVAGLRIHFQPIVNARSGAVIGSEALMRPGPGPLSSPVDLLDAAKRLGRSGALEDRLLEQACAAFEAQGAPHQLFLNCSVQKLLQLATAPPPWMMSGRLKLVLEVTERERPPSPGPLAEAMSSVRRFGAALAIDDLGAGHAGLLSVLSLTPEFVKIDRDVVQLMGERADVAVAVAELLRDDRWGAVIAEGVETTAEAYACLDAGIELQQGFLHARPAPQVVTEVEALGQASARRP